MLCLGCSLSFKNISIFVYIDYKCFSKVPLVIFLSQCSLAHVGFVHAQICLRFVLVRNNFITRQEF